MQSTERGADILASTDPAILASEYARVVQELAESRQQQAATAEIVDIISRSPTNLQPVLTAMAESAARVCQASDASIFRADGDRLLLVAHHGPTPIQPTLPLSRETINGRAVLEGRAVHITDLLAEVDEFPVDSAHSRDEGVHAYLSVPLIRAGDSIGAISLRRTEPQLFTERQVVLLETFAGQAVVAMENMRLFEEVQARTRQLSEALEQQTATSEILRAINRSRIDAQPVFDIIAASSLRLCGGSGYGQVALYDGEWLHLAAFANANPEGVDALRRRFPVRADHGSAMGRAVQTRAVVQISDLLKDSAYAFKSELLTLGVRSVLVVPMLRNGAPIGAIAVGRPEHGLFSDKQIELVTTFADQALIAIENVRLFEEVQARTRDLSRSVVELRALSDVSQTVNASLNLQTVLDTVLAHASEMSDSGGGAIYVLDQARSELALEASRNMSKELIAAVRAHPIPLGGALVGQCAKRRVAMQIEDLTKVPGHPLFEMHLRSGVMALLAVPLLYQNEVIGALVVRRMRAGPFSSSTVNLLQSFASHSAIAIQHARLFHEIEEKSRQIEIASQHKSQFVANMSHELRTPLAAMLGYAELLRDGMFGELPEKSIRIIERVQANGKHLLGLINTVLDIAKIESGQFKLNLGEYSLSSMIETVRVASESLASTKKLSFRTDVIKGLPAGLGDEARLTQVLLNLVGNAIKFTDAGEICISAGARNGNFVVSVSDTGPGIPDEECERIFDKFHQVDSTSTRTKGGTGLGLAIAREIVEMHGGHISVESIVGRGSIFRIELPVCAQASGAAA